MLSEIIVKKSSVPACISFEWTAKETRNLQGENRIVLSVVKWHSILELKNSYSIEKMESIYMIRRNTIQFHLIIKALINSQDMTFNETIQQLGSTQSKEECLRKAYSLLTEKYHWDRLKTYSRFFELFTRNPEKLWIKFGFLHCTNLNILLKALLLWSEHFTKEEIRFCWTQIWIVSPHQYAQVRLDNKWIDIDIWAHRYGIWFGDHAHSFH